MMKREDMITELTKRNCQVTFKKLNGEQRQMLCTLQEEVIPKATKADPLSMQKVRAISDEVIPVWDVSKQAWRSFRVDSVVSFI